MRRARTVAVLAWAGLVALGACSRDKPAPPRNAAGTFSAAPEIPIDTMPKLLASPIAYPPEARAQRIQGSVVVRALVGKDGRVKEATTDTAQAASPVLTEAALAAVRQWTFEPARSKGAPVEIWISVPVQYRLTP